MKACIGCANEFDMKKLLVGEYLNWPAKAKHPCEFCRRFPNNDKPDNFRKMLDQAETIRAWPMKR